MPSGGSENFRSTETLLCGDRCTDLPNCLPYDLYEKISSGWSILPIATSICEILSCRGSIHNTVQILFKFIADLNSMTDRSTYLCICLGVLSICLQSDMVLAKTPVSELYSQRSKSSIEATAKLMELGRKYPNLKIYPAKLLKSKYPTGTICSTLQQTRFIVYVVFDKLPNNEEAGILGENNLALNGVTFTDKDTSESRELTKIAFARSADDAITADRNRPATDKDKPVLYQYRVEFDPATCKK